MKPRPLGSGSIVTPSIITARKTAHEDPTALRELFADVVVGIDSDRGLDLLKGCEPRHLERLAQTMRHHQIPETLAHAGVASATIVINALGLSSRPILEQYDRPDWSLSIKYATQKHMLGAFEKRDREGVEKRGATLEQLEHLMGRCGAKVERFHAEVGVDEMRNKILEALESPDAHAIVNYESGGGHHSPVAAYNSQTDMFLVYDVAPGGAAPIWMTAEQLHRAMNTIDPDSGNSRGFLIARRPKDAAVDFEHRTGVPEEYGGAIVGLDSGEGLELLRGCAPEHLTNLPALMKTHEIQENLALCGVASATIVLNALEVDTRSILDRFSAPALEEKVPRVTQFSLLDLHAAKDKLQIARNGVTLDRLTEIVREAGAGVKTHHASDVGADAFRAMCLTAMTNTETKTHVLVNYGRVALGQKGGGHFSPLAAYNKERDMFLIYDVAPWRADPIWVSTAELHRAMNTIDTDAKKSRGFMLVSKQ